MGKTLQDFINYLEAQVNRAIYIWGAQTQVIRNGKVYKNKSYNSILSKNAEEWIKDVESSRSYANKAISLYNARKNKYAEIPCYDCSGLGMHWIQNITGLSKSDMNANGMMGKCTLINKSDVKKGCWVFKRYKTGSKRAYHIGYVVDDALNVVESQGRAYGVVKRPLSKGGWNAYGIPSYFASEINKQNAVVFKRNLKKGHKGTDVSELQRLLNKAGDDIKVDGVFGTKTRAAVRAYQKAKKLKVDGIAGKNTITALGGKWNG